MKRFDPASVRRVVIKIGSNAIVNAEGLVRLGFLGKLVTTTGRARARGVQVVIVSSGAIAMGLRQLDRTERPDRIQEKQALAAIGQTELMNLYQRLFATLRLQTAQVLLTRADLEDRHRYINARDTLTRVLELGAVPVVNENDSVAVEEIQFGDNDALSALVAGLIDADLMILLTTVDGLYDGDPNGDPPGRLIDTIDRPLDEYESLIRESRSQYGTGGMKTKLEAARLCRQSGIPCVIARANGPTLDQILAGEAVGTYVVPAAKRATGRGRWLAKAASVQGTLTVDDGAARALIEDHRSLLPKGLCEVEGEFDRGAVVVLRNGNRREIGRGIARYGAADLRVIAGRRGNEIESILGFTYGDEVVHRDDLVLT